MYASRVAFALAAICLLSFGGAGSAQDADPKVEQERQQIDARAAESLADFLETVDGAEALLDAAAGYAVFRVTKAGLGVSGAGGTGVAVDKDSGERVYMKMGAGGVGFSIGASRYDVVILFETGERLAEFMTGGWDSAATAQAAAGSESAGASRTFFDGVAYFQLNDKGLMASADVSGTRFWVAEELN